MEKNEKLKKFYDKVYRKGENKHFTNPLLKKSNSEEVNEVLKEIRWDNKKILDVGCGTGLFAFNAAKKGADVLGIDFSEEAIMIAKKKNSLPNLQFKKLNANEINEKFDVIVSLGTLEHMDEPMEILKLFKKNLKKGGKIIITSPNWTNPRGYVLMTLFYLFNSPITLADLHYQTPLDFMKYAKKLGMKLKWRTIDQSWGNGEILIKDFERRIPKVLKDSGLPKKKKNIDELIQWLKNNVVPLDNKLPQSGATGLYVFSKK
jgi:2-polyprenyl-3-methyl-5-hydroxy-6-metoxy-1,4-benzoquinol methylase